MNRTRRDLVVLFLLSLAVRLAVAALISRPGYTDPAYYAAGAVNLAQGGGLSEPFIWNYLDDPSGLPHPGFTYWMPLPSMLAAPFAAVFPGSFFALQLPFALLSALLPLMGYTIAGEVTGVRRHGWMAGLLVLFSGFFFPYWTLPETFAPFALFGSAGLWLAGARREWWANLLAGLLVGLAHLTRSDGVLLLPVVALVSPFPSTPGGTRRLSRSVFGHWLLVSSGYLLVMLPWFARNLVVIGAPLSAAGAKTLWLTKYEDLFCYRCDLSPQTYLAWGWANVLRSKLWAAWVNSQRFFAEDCLVVLFPLVPIGLYRLRHHLSLSGAAAYLLLAYAVHSLAFTFPGVRGGFFHAGAPALPFLFAAGLEGLDVVVGRAARWRRWSKRQAQTIFGAAVIAIAVFLSAQAAVAKLPGWRGVDLAYEKVGHWMDAARVLRDAPVVVGNPSAFWYYTRRPALVVPTGDVEVLLETVEEFGVAHVVLDRARPAALAGLQVGAVSHPRLEPLVAWGEGSSRVVVYRVEQ